RLRAELVRAGSPAVPGGDYHTAETGVQLSTCRTPRGGHEHERGKRHRKADGGKEQGRTAPGERGASAPRCSVRTGGCRSPLAGAAVQASTFIWTLPIWMTSLTARGRFWPG